MSELVSGSRVGVFEVTGLLGEGGMGKVYRARDTRLNRDVALKLLPDAFAADPDRLARFTREAQTLAALNHPHIAQIHGLEETGGVRALVMELVEGEDLAERLARGPLPLDEALPIARQIAEALEAAHEQGIIHRDLKPANIKVKPDGTVKVLDFGLAKAVDPGAGSRAPGSVEAMNSPTLSVHATQAGVILGTAAYMSPEQARGRATDKRSDVWAFGCVLFEMLSGTRAFDGEDATEIIASVVKTTPDWAALPATVPLRIVTLIQRCLEKDRKLRIGDIAVARFLMAEDSTLHAPGAVGAPTSKLAAIAAAIAVILAVALGALAVVHFQEQPPAASVVRFHIQPPADAAFVDNTAVVSPDGTLVAFVGRAPGGETQLWVQSLDSTEARPLAGTANASFPFWSPDSRFLGFGLNTGERRLKKVAVAGGAPQTLSDLPGAWRGGSWSESGVIAFGTATTGLMRVEEGGAPVPLTALDAGRNEGFHSAPWFLPDGRHFLYFRQAGAVSEHTGIYVGTLDAEPGQQQREPLVSNAYGPTYMPSSTSRAGWLFFVREGSLLAQPFDAERQALTGLASSVAEGFAVAGPRPVSASRTGSVAYRIGTTGGARRLTWFDRQGKSIETVGEAGEYNTVSLSPDGSRVVVNRADPAVNGSDLWTHEFARGTRSRLTFAPGSDWLATWSPDGGTIIFSSDRSGNLDLYRKNSNGVGQEEALLSSPGAEYAQDWSRDGRYLLYTDVMSSLDLAVLDLKGERKAQPYLKTEFRESQGRFSPDGRFVAYTSNASGQNQIYVQTFPDPQGGKWMISRDGGVQPRWRRDGRELFFVSADSTMMAVEIDASAAFTPGNPTALFEAPIWGGGSVDNVTRYDVSADGSRFLINAELKESRPTPITFVINWEAMVTRSGLK
jgi:Tol biopolymer transport system component